MTKLHTYLNTIETYIPELNKTNTQVSSSSVGWQADHSLKVINGVINSLKTAPTDKKPKLTLLGRFCLLTRYIPRGKGKAPKVVLPPENISKADVVKQLEEAKTLITELSSINSKATFKHPYFGVLNKKQTIKFVEVHTNHHLKIIKDIMKT